MDSIRKTQPNLIPESRYVVRVRALNAFNVPSEWSDSLVFTTRKDDSTPNPPTNITAGFNDALLMIAWDPTTTNTDDSVITDLKGYELTLTGLNPNATPATPMSFIYFTTDTFFFYNRDQNIADFGYFESSIDISIRAVDFSDNFSVPATATVEDIYSREIALFSRSGTLVVTLLEDSPEWEIEHEGTIYSIIGLLTIPGSVDSIFTVYLNGIVLGTVTIPATFGRGETPLLIPVDVISGDLLAVECTTAAEDAKSVTIKVRVKG